MLSALAPRSTRRDLLPDRSDIDLVVAGIEPREFYAVSARAAALTDFTLDLTPFENMRASFRRDLDQYGVDL